MNNNKSHRIVILAAATVLCGCSDSRTQEDGEGQYALPALAAHSAVCAPSPEGGSGAMEVTFASDALVLGRVVAIRAAEPDVIYGPFGTGVDPEECDEGALSPALLVEVADAETLYAAPDMPELGKNIEVLIPHDVYSRWEAHPIFEGDAVSWSSDGALGSLELGMSLGLWLLQESPADDLVTVQSLLLAGPEGRLSVQLAADEDEHGCPGAPSDWDGVLLDDVRAEIAARTPATEIRDARSERARLAMERAHFCASASELQRPCETVTEEDETVLRCAHPYFCNTATGLCEFRTPCETSDRSSCPAGMVCAGGAEPFCNYVEERAVD